MKPTAVVINLARGSIVDQDAMNDALNSGRLAGAGLDVFDPEPLEDGNPLFRTRNLLLTPHVSGISPMLWRRQIDLFIENIRRFREELPLLNLIDKQRGY
jgi:phosphoglycerate dehydrogenase-like enzyme